MKELCWRLLLVRGALLASTVDETALLASAVGEESLLASPVGDGISASVCCW